MSDLSEDDLKRLIESAVRENRRIEYKVALPGPEQRDKVEYLADLSAFANSEGGDLYFGIREIDGVATELSGIESVTLDPAIQRLENLLRDGVAPALPRVETTVVKLASGRSVLRQRVRRSWLLPHRVILGGHDKFYARNDAGKYPMSVDQLRGAYLASSDRSERIKAFRSTRLAEIAGPGSWLTHTEPGGTLVLHLLPAQAFEEGQRLQLPDRKEASELLFPLYSSYCNTTYNLDGLINTAVIDGRVRSYTQLYRNGVIEAASQGLLRVRDGRRVIPSLQLERDVKEAFVRFIALQEKLGTSPPSYFALSLLFVKDFYLATRGGDHVFSEHLIDRPHVAIPEIEIPSYGADPWLTLKPAFDMFWNACGYESSENYDSQGLRIADRT